MKILKRSTIAVLASLCALSSAHAQTMFSFSTRGCFYLGSSGCTTAPAFLTSTSQSLAGNAAISFTGASLLNRTPDASGYLALPNIGTFGASYNSNNPLSLTGLNLMFSLLVDFTLPSGVSPNGTVYSGAISGAIKEDQGAIYWDPTPGNYDFTYDGGGSFRMSVLSNVVVDPNSFVYAFSTPVSASIDCSPGSNAPCVDPALVVGKTQSVTSQPVVTPEPSTYALMAAGLASLGVVARRRRKTA